MHSALGSLSYINTTPVLQEVLNATYASGVYVRVSHYFFSELMLLQRRLEEPVRHVNLSSSFMSAKSPFTISYEICRSTQKDKFKHHENRSCLGSNSQCPVTKTNTPTTGPKNRFPVSVIRGLFYITQVDVYPNVTITKLFMFIDMFPYTLAIVTTYNWFDCFSIYINVYSVFVFSLYCNL